VNRLASALAFILIAAPAFADGLEPTATNNSEVSNETRVAETPLVLGLGAAPLPVAPKAQGPYFRPLDPLSPRLIAGAYLDAEDAGRSEAGTALALLTHSTEDGCLVPRLVCTDWTPLAAGVLSNGGKVKFAFGPAFNLAPVLKGLALKGLNAVSKDDSFRNLKSTLGSQPITGPDATISVGPAWVVAPTENFKGYFRVFLGGELRFGKKKG
jgi:hypothetical protein